LDWIQHPQKSNRFVAVALAGKSHGHPSGGMRVLTAIFPYAGRVSLNVANVGGCFVERGSEEQDQAIAFTHEVFLKRSQRDLYAVGVAGVGNRSPSLGSESMRASAFFLDPKGLPSSRYPRRYHSPSQA